MGRSEEDLLEPGEVRAEEELKEEAPSEDDVLSSLRLQCDEYQDLLQRRQAEFENFKKRTLREKAELRRMVEADILAELLDVVDACEAGLASMQTCTFDESSYIAGYELLLKQLRSILGKYQVEEVPGPGSTFDPSVHEALVREVSADHEEHEILEQFRKGYILGNRLLRPAQVKVAVRPDE